MWTARDPFSVNGLAVAAGLAALDDVEHVERTRAAHPGGEGVPLRRLRSGWGSAYVPSEANFILFDAGRPAAEVFDRLLRRGVLVRPCASFGLPGPPAGDGGDAGGEPPVRGGAGGGAGRRGGTGRGDPVSRGGGAGRVAPALREPARKTCAKLLVPRFRPTCELAEHCAGSDAPCAPDRPCSLCPLPLHSSLRSLRRWPRSGPLPGAPAGARRTAEVTLEPAAFDPAGLDPSGELVLTSLRPLTLAAVEAALAVEPAVSLRIQQADSEGTRFTIAPAAALEPNRIYRFRLAREAGLDRDYQWSFQTRAEFRSAGHAARAPVDGRSRGDGHRVHLQP